MKNNVTLSIPKLCTEKWNNFTPTQDGGFCGTCSKIVVDFTKMSDSQILHYLKSKSAQTCGRLRSDQLKSHSYQELIMINLGLSLLKIGLISFLLILLSKQTFAQNTNTKANSDMVQQQPNNTIEKNSTIKSDQKIKGIVTSVDDQSPLPGVNIYLKGSTEGAYADASGQFEFAKKLKEGDVLVFSFIGFETQEYIIPKQVPSEIQIHMPTASIEMMGAVAVHEVYSGNESGIARLWKKVKAIF